MQTTLSRSDGAVLQHIFDPESAASATAPPMIDDSLPRDPHYTDATHALIQSKSQAIIKTVEQSLASASALAVSVSANALDTAAQNLQSLIKDYPDAGSLHNDLAQVLRLRWGSTLISRSLVQSTEASSAAAQALHALDQACRLLAPPSPLAALSPVQTRTLSAALMQRGAMKLEAAKHVAAAGAGVKDAGVEHDHTALPALQHASRTALETAASADFFSAGRYGNDLGRAMAVHANPTAKLCGQMVQDAMRREFATGRER